MDAPDDDQAVTRRQVLGSAAGLTATAAWTGTATAAGRPAAARSAVATPTVMTQNAYVGVDLSRLLSARSVADVKRIAGDFLAEVDPAVYAARADAIAAQIDASGADVVALQEAATLRTQRPGDFGSDSPEPATNVVVDLPTLLTSALADRGLEYDLVVSAVTTDVELPAETDGGPVDVRITDRDALLVRSDLETDSPETDTYDAAVSVPIPASDRDLTVGRGYCAADVTMDGVTFRAVSTHLESAVGLLRRQQAAELLDSLSTDRPVLLAGDFNSGPGADTATYDRLTESFRDPYTVLDPDSQGDTCCQQADLENEGSQLDHRVDGILYRGDVQPTAVGRVGHRPEDRVAVETGDGTVEIWPSDHAGVVGTFEVSAATSTAMPSATSAPEPETTGRSTTQTTVGGAGPGFGLLAAVVGLGLGAAARIRRK